MSSLSSEQINLPENINQGLKGGQLAFMKNVQNVTLVNR